MTVLMKKTNAPENCNDSKVPATEIMVRIIILVK